MTKGRNTTKIGVRLQDDALDRLTASAQQSGSGIGTFLRAILEQDVPARYAYLIEDSRRSLKSKFSAGELSLMCDICNGTVWVPVAAIHGGILANCEDAETSYYPKWGVDRPTFLGKLRALPMVEQFTLVDAIETFWRAVSADQNPEPARILD